MKLTVQDGLFDIPVQKLDEIHGNLQIREVTASDILTKASGFMGDYDFTLNPYSGCAFGCSYCYAAFFARDTEKIKNWGFWVDVKMNALALLQKRRNKPLIETKIYMSSVTDPYQSIEKKLELSRSILEELGAYHKVRLTIQTRSPLVTRDIDLLKKIHAVQVNITVTTDNEAIRKAFEPLCPSIEKRLKTAQELVHAGISTCITLTPLLPLSDPSIFAQRLIDTGVEKFVVQPFHPLRGKFIAGTREVAKKTLESLGWTDEKYDLDAKFLKSKLMGIKEGKDGFAPI
jgi:DNA repair photolyase